MGVKLPSIQYNQNIRNQVNARKRAECEKARAEAQDKQNLSRLGEGYIGICPQIIFNEKEKKCGYLKMNIPLMILLT